MPTPDHRPSPLRLPVKWLHLESLESFTRRLLTANSLDARMLRLATAPGVQEDRYLMDDHAAFVEGLADYPVGHYERLKRLAQPDRTLKYLERFLCRLCAAGDNVEQVPHDRENWCLRHPGQMVWVGPGTTPESQLAIPFDRALENAERRFRRLVAAGRIDARLHARAWEMVRDNAWLAMPDGWKPALAKFPDDHEIRGRASLYPETTAVLEILSDPTTIERWQTRPPDDLRDDILKTLPPMSGPIDILVERIVLWLRPLRREIRPTRVDPLNVPMDIVDASAIIDKTAPYPRWIQRHPRAIAEWNWNRNDSAQYPWDGAGASKKAWWVCDEGHSWETSPQVRGQAESSCPYCVRQAVWPGHTDLRTLHPEIAAQWVSTPGVNAGDPDHASAMSSRTVRWECPLGHRWATTINSRTGHRSGCPYCIGRRAIPGATDLATLRPDLTSEWDTARNGALSPTAVVLGSHEKTWWRCGQGHSWQAAISARTAKSGRGCPYCANRAVLSGFNDLATTHPQLSAQWGVNNSKTPQEVTFGSSYYATWLCDVGHVWEAQVGSRARLGAGCPYCANRAVLHGFNDLATTNPELAAEWDSTSGANDRTPSDVTCGSNYRAGWTCGRDHHWHALIRTRMAGHGCPYCAGQRAIHGETDLGTIRPDLAAEWDSSNELTPRQVTCFSDRKVAWHCVKGHVWRATVANRSGGRGCPYCAGKRSLRNGAAS